MDKSLTLPSYNKFRANLLFFLYLPCIQPILPNKSIFTKFYSSDSGLLLKMVPQVDFKNFFAFSQSKESPKINFSIKHIKRLTSDLKNDTITPQLIHVVDSTSTHRIHLNEIEIQGGYAGSHIKDGSLPIQFLNSKDFKLNFSSSLHDALQLMNGVLPVINCSVCNTGDIQINGLEGIYTLVLLDGCPIVSSLGTVYGLMGIPTNIIERIEIMKGPAPSYYDSEAIAGTINIVTKSVERSPRFGVQYNMTSWKESNLDVYFKTSIHTKLKSMFSLNFNHYDQIIDNNADGFTDLAIQKRISVFNKWEWRSSSQNLSYLSMRYVYEDRWGGQNHWNSSHRGSPSIYGESIYTKRFELFGQSVLHSSLPLKFQYSIVSHDQNSYYGISNFNGTQRTGFFQLKYDKTLSQHRLYSGIAFKQQYYNDNTVATVNSENSYVPSTFIQFDFNNNHRFSPSIGTRLDYHHIHGLIHHPRIFGKYKFNNDHIIRWNCGSASKFIHLFTEDHASLSGARNIEIIEELRAERSWSYNLNYLMHLENSYYDLDFELNGFLTHYKNKIIPDYDTDPSKIIYKNLYGKAISRGINLQVDYSDLNLLQIQMGLQFQDVFQTDSIGIKTKAIRAPNWSANFSIQYTLPKINCSLSLRSNWLGPQRMPIVPNDFRSEYSESYGITNVQLNLPLKFGLELYGGVKNIFNYIPNQPILRPFDPFNQTADDPIENPNNFRFDPSYYYASMQGIRFYIGCIYQIK